MIGEAIEPFTIRGIEYASFVRLQAHGRKDSSAVCGDMTQVARRSKVTQSSYASFTRTSANVGDHRVTSVSRPAPRGRMAVGRP